MTAAAIAVAGLAGCSRDQGSTKAFCGRVKQVPSLETALARFSETDPDVLADRIAQARTAYHDLADAAPKAIRSQADAVVSLVDDILDAVADHPDDPAEAADQLRKAMTDHKGVDAARTKVADYAQEHCGVRLDPALATTGTPTTTSPTDPSGTTTTSTPGSPPGDGTGGTTTTTG